MMRARTARLGDRIGPGWNRALPGVAREMRPVKLMCGWRGAWLAAWLLLASQARAQVSLATVVDLAVRNSAPVRVALAEVQRATAGLQESKDAYLPSFVLGSAVGYTYGFPVGQPSVYNINSNSLLYSFSQ